MKRGVYIGEVERSTELLRIASLPRRSGPPIGTELLSEALKLSGGKMDLRPVQAWALAELNCVGGLFAPIRVGGGKTLITFLAPHMVEAETPLLLVPAKLRQKTFDDFCELDKHWRRPSRITVASYELLGKAQWADFMENLNPDLIMADEAHYLKNCRAAVTRRVGRYMGGHPNVNFVALSGTITKRSLFDFAHLMEWCLGDGAPIPLSWPVLDNWSRAIDEDSVYAEWYRPGALKELCGEEWASYVVRHGNERLAARGVYHKRLVDTPGVVATEETPIDASLSIEPWCEAEKLVDEVQDAQRVLHERWETPDGVPIEAPVEVWRHARELALGFYYRWVPDPPEEWLEARKEWSAFVRERLGNSRTLDSPAQVARAFRNEEVYKKWLDVRDTYSYTTEPVWLDERILKQAVKWASKVPSPGGLVWTQHRAVGERLEKLGLPYYGNLGMRQGVPVEKAKGSVALSVAANKEGRNLQRYNRNLILTPPTTGSAWEQMLGRTHRDGQQSDEVTAEVFTGCRESHKALWQAVSDAEYQQALTGSPQKLLVATITVARPE